MQANPASRGPAAELHAGWSTSGTPSLPRHGLQAVPIRVSPQTKPSLLCALHRRRWRSAGEPCVRTACC